MILLVGLLANPELRKLLAPDAVTAEPLRARLAGGDFAGIRLDGWPVLIEDGEGLPAFRSDWTPALRHYAQIFGLRPLNIDGQQVLGAAAGPLVSESRTSTDWQVKLAVAIARHLLALPYDLPVERLQRRLPMIAGWVASQLRADDETQILPICGPAGAERWALEESAEPYAAFFSVEEQRLRHRLHDGGWSDPLLRAIFVSGDAAVVLPWDMVRDRVLLIDQFRAAPAARGDRQPWLFETIAGRVDVGETPQDAARREAVEEAGLGLERLIPGPHCYPSPGVLAEFLYLFVGLADLPDGSDGTGGLASEAEDIRSHLMPRAELTRMALAGEIRNGPLLTLALWLELNAARIRKETGQGAVR